MALVVFGTEIAGDVPLVAEVDDPADRLTRVSMTADGLYRAAQTFEQAMGRMKAIAAMVAASVRELSPDETELELGFKLSAEAGVVLTKLSGDGHITLKLTWKKGQSPEK